MSLAESLQAPDFSRALETGEIVNQSGYHQPQNQGHYHPHCGCVGTTEKGAYRDVTIELSDGTLVHYYHQNPVVVERNGVYRVSSCGWNTKTTKERINRYLPRGYFVRQRDFEWFLETPSDNELEFSDGMTLVPDGRVAVSP